MSATITPLHKPKQASRNLTQEIEDADDLHLALKPMFAATIQAWAKHKKVQDEFAEHTPGGKDRLDVGRLNWYPTFDRILDLVAYPRCLCG